MSLQLTGNDFHGSPLLSLSNGTRNTLAWSPFGGSAARTGTSASLPGFNGERQDPLSGVTHLGNGYRAYSPALRRFTCPDSESPFGIGGINPYVYCDNDPINMTDPSGHGPITWLIRKAIGFAIRIGIKSALSEATSAALATISSVETGLELASSAATGIASQATRKSNPQASSKLGWASLGLGLAGGFGVGEASMSQIQRRSRGVSGWAERVTNKGSGTPQMMKGNMENMTVISGDAFYTYEDIYKGERRLNIAGHGDFVEGQSGIVNAGALLDADDVLRLLDAKGINVNDYANIRTIVCHSAEGGELSLASRLFQKTGIPVKGFNGTVTAIFPPESLDEFRNLAYGTFPTAQYNQTETEELIRQRYSKKTHTIVKKNPYRFLSSPILYSKFEYSPVKFS